MKKNIFLSGIIALLMIFNFNVTECKSQGWLPVPDFQGTNFTVNVIKAAGVGTNPYIYIGTTGAQGCLYRSTNNGLNFSLCNTGLPANDVWDIYFDDTNLYLSMSNGGIYLSSNFGNNWIARNSGIPNNYVFETGHNKWLNHYYSIVYGNGFYKSTNYGSNWYPSNAGLTSLSVRSLEFFNNNLYVGTLGNGIFKSSDGGNNWYLAINGLGTGNVHDITVAENSIFAAVFNSGVYSSTDQGASWQSKNIGLSDPRIYRIGAKIEFPDNNSVVKLFAGTQTGVFYSPNEGNIWYQKNEGFTGTPVVLSICAIGDSVYAGTQGQGLWRRPLNQFVNVKKINTNIPDKFDLFQNYPNPFNPITKIRFAIPSNLSFPRALSGNPLISLKIYNILGKEVATLVNESLKPGTYEVTFDGTNLTTGIYYYRLKTEFFISTRKLVLLK